ncbi:MAG: hypothetical protein HeimC3_22480 [Candidatus Heimdallarchaeota archaeon LC_3]|nr:MAG: hypothetical protein HeimC3_22480 [Candidatus Heimdallarchaeota archaeon LC_3]
MEESIKITRHKKVLSKDNSLIEAIYLSILPSNVIIWMGVILDNFLNGNSLFLHT